MNLAYPPGIVLRDFGRVLDHIAEGYHVDGQASHIVLGESLQSLRDDPDVHSVSRASEDVQKRYIHLQRN